MCTNTWIIKLFSQGSSCLKDFDIRKENSEIQHRLKNNDESSRINSSLHDYKQLSSTIATVKANIHDQVHKQAKSRNASYYHTVRHYASDQIACWND